MLARTCKWLAKNPQFIFYGFIVACAILLITAIATHERKLQHDVTCYYGSEVMRRKVQGKFYEKPAGLFFMLNDGSTLVLTGDCSVLSK